MSTTLEFTLNGQAVHVADAAVHTTLLQYLRANGRTGSKEGCAEGDCGACTVVLVERDAHGAKTYRAINSCIALLPMMAGREVWTAEGIAQDGPHPVQAALEKHYGSQCGYCTPGFAMSMFEAYHRDDAQRPDRIADQLCGNLCRCTGYRPIRDAMVDAFSQRDKRDRFHLALVDGPEPVPAIEYEGGGEKFFRPTTVDELLALRSRHADASLVMGATEIGVEINKKVKRFPVLISIEAIASLRAVRKSDDGREWLVGGAATLTELEEALAGDIPAIDKMLAVFASRQIRNRASLAANLVTASPIGDMAPVLLALDATLVLRSLRGARDVAIGDFFVGYRKTVLAADEIVEAIRIPRGPSAAGLTRHVVSYKVSKRREMDISAVAAGLRVDLDAHNVVRYARLGYGGVAATPVRARETEAALVGKPWTRASVDAVLPTLAREFQPIDDVRCGAPYRRELITSLLEKFVDGAESEAMEGALDFTTSQTWECDSPSRALLHESGRGHATGHAQYVDDQAMRSEMLEIWPVSSPHAHAKVLSIDITEAAKMPGVVAIYTARDIPGMNDVGALRHDEILLADREVLFHGHMVAIVVATSYELARAASMRVKVEYEVLPAILDIESAVRANSFHTEPHIIRRGDASAAIASAPHKLAGSFELGGQEHFYLETQAAWAERGDDGDVTVVSSTQHPSEIQAVVAHVLDLPRNKVVVQSPRMGGGFGGKETQGNTWASLVALAAWKTGKRVRVQLDRDVDMSLTGKRHPFRANFEAGFDTNGKLLALKADLFSNGGWSLDLSESICDRALFHIDNAYYIPAVHVAGRVCKTNLVSNTAFRGFGGPQGMVIIEEILDRIARRVGKTPEQVRAANLYSGDGETNTTHYGQLLEDNRIQTVWSTLARESELGARRAEVEAFNRRSPRIKRGIAITPVKFGISFTASFLNQAGALVIVYRDGSVQVNHGGTEMGQGLYTKMLGIAMRELGAKADRIRVMKTQTDKVPNTSPTAASAGADLNGQAVRNACVALRERLAPVAMKLLEAKGAVPTDPEGLLFADGVVSAPGTDVTVTFEDVASNAYLQQVQLSATGYYRTPGLAYDRSKGHGKPFHYFAYGAAVTEVEIDGYTGMKRVRRVDVLHDVGESLHPSIDRGQIEGGFVQGMGWLTAEELKWDAKGRLLSHSASTYQIPAISDAPADFRVHLLPRAPQNNTIHGSKAVGEPPLMLALSVREAIRDAIAAFGTAGGEVPLASPATHEAILHAVRARIDASAQTESLAASNVATG